MTEFDKDLQYITHIFNRSNTISELNELRRLFKHFLDKWSVRLSPTDPTFIKIKQDWGEKIEEKYKKISKLYI